MTIPAQDQSLLHLLLDEAQTVAQSRHQRFVESEGTVEVGDTDEDMGQQHGPSLGARAVPA